MTDFDKFMGKLQAWHWSPDPPTQYLVNGRGIGNYATEHPGAFNLAWALSNGPTGAQYRASFNGANSESLYTGWLPAAIVLGFALFRREGLVCVPLDDAAKMTLSEFLAQLDDNKAYAIGAALKFDFRQRLLQTANKA